MAQYIPDVGGVPQIKIEPMQFSSGWAALAGGNFTNSTGLPSAVRITMDICDQQRRHIRTFSRVVWIPSTTN